MGSPYFSMALRNFNPRSPCGERRDIHGIADKVDGISIHAPRAGGDDTPAGGMCPPIISIHTPRAESDLEHLGLAVFAEISIHAPRAGSDCSWRLSLQRVGISIHAPRAGSDKGGLCVMVDAEDFNPRSPCGERPAGTILMHTNYFNFNPRPPCGERQGRATRRRCACGYFNPRPPCGERRLSRPYSPPPRRISIHAPRAGSDLVLVLCPWL